MKTAKKYDIVILNGIDSMDDQEWLLELEGQSLKILQTIGNPFVDCWNGKHVFVFHIEQLDLLYRPEPKSKKLLGKLPEIWKDRHWDWCIRFEYEKWKPYNYQKIDIFKCFFKSKTECINWWNKTVNRIGCKK